MNREALLELLILTLAAAATLWVLQWMPKTPIERLTG